MKLTTCLASSELIWFCSTWAWGWLKMPQESRYPGRGAVPDGCGCFNHLVSDALLAKDFYRKEPPCPNPTEMVFPALRCVSYCMSCRVIPGFLKSIWNLSSVFPLLGIIGGGIFPFLSTFSASATVQVSSDADSVRASQHPSSWGSSWKRLLFQPMLLHGLSLVFVFKPWNLRKLCFYEAALYHWSVLDSSGTIWINRGALLNPCISALFFMSWYNSTGMCGQESKFPR